MKQESESCVYLAWHICLISFRQDFHLSGIHICTGSYHINRDLKEAWEVKRLAEKYIKEGGKKTAIVRKGNISFSLFNWRGLVRSFWVCAPAPWPTRSLQGGRYLEVGSCRSELQRKNEYCFSAVFSNETTKLFSGITFRGKRKKELS